jgi:hypothetical protein
MFKYNQQDATLYNSFISAKCLRYFLRPSSGAQIPDAVCIVFGLLMIGGGTRLKHVEHFTEIDELHNVASCWLNLKMIIY